MIADDKIITGLENLGRCVDLLELDPLDVSSSCKNIQAILIKKDATYKQAGYTIPQGVEATHKRKTTIDGGDTLMFNSYDFQREFSSDMSLDAGVPGLFEFSASKTFKTTTKQTESREDVFTYVRVTSEIHRVSLDLQRVSLDPQKQSDFFILNSNFKNRVEKLPTTLDTDDDRKAYSKFIEEFGTHFLSGATLGGMAYSRVSCKRENVNSLSEKEETFKHEAKFQFEQMSAGAKTSETNKEALTRDKKHNISRSRIEFVGGTGSVESIKDEWLKSLEEMSVPIANGLKLRRLSDLLTDDDIAVNFFANVDKSAMATRKKLLHDATSFYIKKRGGDEMGRIRYGQPVQLFSVPDRWRLYCYDGTGGDGADKKLRRHEPGAAIRGGWAPGTFEIQPSRGVSGDDVLAGDFVTLKIRNTGDYMTLEPSTSTNPAFAGRKGLRYSKTAKPEGEYSLRIADSGQMIEGDDMEKKKRPLVSGDIVMVSAPDKGQNTFYWFSWGHEGGVACGMVPRDPLFGKPATDVSTWQRGLAVIRNA